MRFFKIKYKESSDEELMNLLSKGDKKAFDEIYQRYSGILMGYFFKMLWQNKEKAEDMVHELFIKIIRKPAYFDPQRSFKTWVFSVACNMCKNEYKKAEVRKKTSNDLDMIVPQISSENVFNQVQDMQFKEAFETAFQKLELKHREVFALRHFEGLSIKEIAEAVDANEGTIKSRLFYATKQMAEQLKIFKTELTI